MSGFLRGFGRLGLVCVFISAASAAEIKGVLLDRHCAPKAHEQIHSGTGEAPAMEGGMLTAEAHTLKCLRMAECEKAGYGVYTTDNKFLVFDAAGNRKAIEALKLSKRTTDIRVEVTGEVQGDTIKVVSLKLP